MTDILDHTPDQPTQLTPIDFGETQPNPLGIDPHEWLELPIDARFAVHVAVHHAIKYVAAENPNDPEHRFISHPDSGEHIPLGDPSYRATVNLVAQTALKNYFAD